MATMKDGNHEAIMKDGNHEDGNSEGWQPWTMATMKYSNQEGL